MNPPIRMVSVPEPTEAMIEVLRDWYALQLGRPITKGKARKVLRRVLTAAPVREEGGAVRQAIIDFDVEEYVEGYEFAGDEGFYTPTEDERALLTDAIHGVLSELSLATREEAPEEAGALIQELSDAARWRRMPGNENHHATAALFERAVSALRAQPQVREEAQPDERGAYLRDNLEVVLRAVADMAKVGIEVAKAGPNYRTEERDRARIGFVEEVCRRWAATPSAPEAEKLRPSTGTHWWNPDNDEEGFSCWGDAFEDATFNGWDAPVRLERAKRLPDVWAVRIDMDTDGDGEADDHEVHLFATEAEALEARQALAAAPGEAGE